MKNEHKIYFAEVPSGFTDDLVQATDDAISWGNAVGLGVIASIMAIALVQFLFFRN